MAGTTVVVEEAATAGAAEEATEGAAETFPRRLAVAEAEAEGGTAWVLSEQV